MGDRQKHSFGYVASNCNVPFVSLTEKKEPLTAYGRVDCSGENRQTRDVAPRLVAEPLSKIRRSGDKRFPRRVVPTATCFPSPLPPPLPLKTQEYKFHARQFAKSGVAMRMLSAPILICSLSSLWRIRPEKFKEYSNLGRVYTNTYTQAHVRACVSSSLVLPLARTFMHRDVRGMCVEQFTPTRSAAANSVYFHWLFLFRALLKTVERCLKIRRALYRLLLHTHAHTHISSFSCTFSW